MERLQSHDLSLKGRKDLEVTGVEKVDTFDDREVVVVTALGVLRIEGDNLHIRALDLESGRMTLDGDLSGLLYREGSGRKVGGLFRRLMR